MRWTAVMPLKQGPDRKSRLASVLTLDQRIALSDRMAAHVLACLDAVPIIETRLLLSPHPALGATWVTDGGHGLNAELAALQQRPLLVIHADLPFLSPDDIAALLAAAERDGAGIAPDRHGTGTNALALTRPGPFPFAFGPDSCAQHKRSMDGAMAIVDRDGLAFDLDMPDDLAEASRRGFG